MNFLYSPVSLEFSTFLPQTSQDWNYWHVPPHPTLTKLMANTSPREVQNLGQEINLFPMVGWVNRGSWLLQSQMCWACLCVRMKQASLWERQTGGSTQAGFTSLVSQSCSGSMESLAFPVLYYTPPTIDPLFWGNSERNKTCLI